ncbi:cytochrome ubiquinol oxidase subunit II [Paenibacillus sp. FSL H8-0548]|uniref:ubiquinol oxidase subunit II n=1 Tax=Paenibacillus sp. FSL H8-0548 TaxID=1920422 RepID=UPI00096EE405|nr:ubiquinol oxidase subunit II [Paenibacillus sp. FSL H8-0548]OMF29127.1 cytochrome ubiquinol oxidase subunit II [Paenibacillus sp. FSL H8-0548]
MRPFLRTLTPVLIMLMAVVLSGCGEQFLVLDPKGPIGESQKDLIYFSTILCSVIIIPVLILAAFIIWRYRDKPNRKASYTPNWEHSTKLEVTWWGIPIVVILILAVVTVRYTYALEPSKPIESAKEAITIEVTSLDWKWLFTYPDSGISTVNYIKIPEDVPIKFRLTSDTAMNSFWVPQLGGQIYTMSGMAMTLYLQADEQGSYYGSGANFTGEHFAQMTFKVDATSEEEYQAWIDDVKASSPALTMDGFEALTEPGVSDVQLFSSSPEGLFDKVVMQYVNGGGSAHQHHGSGAAKPAETKDDETTTESTTESHDHMSSGMETTTQNHAGH